MTKDEFIKMATEELTMDGFEVVLQNSHSMDGCSGWFNHESKEFRVAKKSKNFFETFVHEYCHYLQWKYSPIFWNRSVNGYLTYVNFLFNKRRYTKKHIEQSFADVLSIEHDCESRAIKLIKDFELDVDVEKYAKFANLYLWHYQFTLAFRKWLTKPLYSKAIIDTMPTEIMPLSWYFDLRNLSDKNVDLISKKFE